MRFWGPSESSERPFGDRGMDLEKQLRDRKRAIIRRWFDLIMETYPEDSRRFLKKEKDLFSNPVGQTVRQELEDLFDGMISGGDQEKIHGCLENIIRIRAVQDMKPSEAVGFVLLLKRLVRQEGGGASESLAEFDDRIDQLALTAFDIYSKCRHKIYQLRVNEVQNQVGRLLKRANLVYEIPDEKAGL